MLNHAQYFKEYREKIGFRSQKEARDYLSAKNIFPDVNYEYINKLNERISEIAGKINKIIDSSYSRKDISIFCKNYIYDPYKIIMTNGLLPKMNNQGRRPEEVLFSWLRGYVVSELFTPVFSEIFQVKIDSITRIGDDDFKEIDTFKRTPKADLEISTSLGLLRIEVQSGFQGINDIKEHKVREAKRVFEEKGIKTVCIHIDLYNGQVAFVRLDSIAEDDVNFVTRQQMEGQSVFSIDQNYFKWRLLDPIPKLKDLEIEI